LYQATHRICLLILACIFFTQTGNLRAQAPVNDSISLAELDTVKKKRIEIINTDLFEFETTDSNTIRKFFNNVFFRHENINFECDRALQYMDTEIMVASGDVHIEKTDSFDIWSESLVYYSREKLAEFRGKVLFEDSTAQLLTDSFNYNLNTDIGRFWSGGVMKNDTSLLSSDEGTYYHRRREAFFYGNVHLTNPDFDLYSDSMRYDTREKVAYFIAPTKIINGEDIIYCESGYYDTRTNKAQFGGNTEMSSGTTRISADELEYDKNEGRGEASGNVIWEDTVEQITILAQRAEYEDSLSYVMATDDPLLIDVTGDDTLYMSADTLVTFKVPPRMKEIITDTLMVDTTYTDTLVTYRLTDTTWVKAKDSTRVFYAYADAKLLQGRMSGVCDSMYFSTADSVFRMHYNPLMWVDTTQFSGDSMHMVLKNKELNRVRIFRNAMIIHESFEGIYDQTKGKGVTGYFKDDNLTRMEIDGNGESIYFVQDDSSAYVAGNKTLCSRMVIYMKEGKSDVDNITFLTKPEATLTPFSLINLATYKLPGFSWHIDRKPATVTDVVRYLPLYEYYLQKEAAKKPIPDTNDQMDNEPPAESETPLEPDALFKLDEQIEESPDPGLLK